MIQNSFDRISEEGDDPKDLQTYRKAMRQLKLATAVSLVFIAVQLLGGYIANSIAIFTDTAHLASDLIGFAMSMAALRTTTRIQK